MKETKRPITLRMEGFKEDLNRAVINSELPACLLEILMEQYLQGISREWEHMESESKTERSGQHGGHQ